MTLPQTTPASGHRFTPARHRPALDGIRTIAVLSVMLYHYPFDWARGGFLGVDVFFVLSGYLITGVLTAEHDRWGRLDLFGFYVRRARRLLPALLLVVLFITAVGPQVLSPAARSQLRGDGLATLLYVANWRFIAEGTSYFSQFGDATPYKHMWSLAIEEQYYVVLPMILAALFVTLRHTRRGMAAALAGLAALSAIWCAVQYGDGTADPSRVYYGTDTRVQELLIGAALAMLLPTVRTRLRRISPQAMTGIGVVALAAILGCFALVSESDAWLYRGGFAAFCLLCVALVVSIEIDRKGPLAAALAARPVAWIGAISYGLYLWHWPIYVFVSASHTGLSGPLLFVARIGATFAAATASYYLVEQPIRSGGFRRRVGHLPSLLAGLAAPLALLLAVVATTSGIPYVPQAKAGQQLTTGDQVDATAGRRILIVGDSVAFALGYNFPKADYPGTDIVGKVRIGCGTAVQWLVVDGAPQKSENLDCRQQFGEWSAGVAEVKPQVVVWMLGPWDVYDRYLDGKVVTEQSPAYASYFAGRLDQGLAALGKDAKVVIPDVPCYDAPKTVVEGHDLAPTRNDPARAKVLNTILTSWAAKHRDRVKVVDYGSWVCPNGRFDNVKDGKQVREDGVHFTADGVPMFWHWLMPQLKNDFR